MEQEKNGSKSGKNTKKIILGVLILAVVLIAGIIAYSFKVSNVVEKWDDKIYPGIKVNGVDLSNKTKEEAASELEDSFGKKINDKELVLKAEDQVVKVKYGELSPEYNINEVVEEAFNYGKDGNMFAKNSLIKKGANKELQLTFKYDESKIEQYEEELKKKVNQEPKNATLNINGGGINVVKGSTGKKVNEEELNQMIKDSISGDLDKTSEVNADVEVVQPKVTSDVLSKVDGRISSYTTTFASSDANRSENIAIAARYINGTVVMPGEEFSYNEVVGDRSAARGFKTAHVYVGDKVQNGVGGGVCQVSSALYKTVIEAGLKSTERHNHSMTVGYAAPGTDATVAWGSLDYKFKNTYDFPVYIEAINGNKSLTFNIYGNKAGMDGKSYKLIGETIANYEPTTTTVTDSSLPLGQQVVEKSAMRGCKANSYLITYQNGAEVNREKISTDVYAKVDGVIKVGSKQ